MLVLQAYVLSCRPQSIFSDCCSTAQIKNDDEHQNEDGVYTAPRASESRFSALKLWKWKTHKEDEEFAAQVMREEGNLQRDPRSTDSQRVRKSNESGVQHGQPSSGAVVDTQPLPSKGMEA